jgi:large subunit ribosomal protein L29
MWSSKAELIMAKKAEKFRDLDATELERTAVEMREKMFRIKFSMSMGQADGVKKMREMKKDLARVLTERRARQVQVAQSK